MCVSIYRVRKYVDNKKEREQFSQPKLQGDFGFDPLNNSVI